MSPSIRKTAAIGSQLQFTIDAHRETIRNTTIESSHSLHITISEQTYSQNRGSNGVFIEDLKFFRAHHDKHALETPRFRQTGAGRADRAGRYRYAFEEFHFQMDEQSSKPNKAAVTKRQMVFAQEEMLRGIHLSDTDDIQLSRGRDGYNNSLGADLIEDELDIRSFHDKVDISALPLDRFLESPGPWTSLDLDLSQSRCSRHHVLVKQKKGTVDL